MHNRMIEQALEYWGLSGAKFELIAYRENQVYKITYHDKTYALRCHRQGLRSERELNSELQWMHTLHETNILLAPPVPTLDKRLFVTIDGIIIDLLAWIEGKPMGENGQLCLHDNMPQIYMALGQTMAQMHQACDAWALPLEFSRHAWNKQGLLGDNPLWGRFWQNPALNTEQLDLVLKTKDKMEEVLNKVPDLDYGLIHADLVPENVLIQENTLYFIDFDDGGFGYRLFDLATVLNKAKRSSFYAQYRDAFLQGYLEKRSIDLTHLLLFQTLRAFTYLGWIIPRMDEENSKMRNERFILEAMACAQHFWEEYYE